jgi:imidazolonepropionase-like amidohydrolase
MPGFIDTHVHLCLAGLNLPQQILQCSAAKALAGLHLAQQYMRYGFTTLRDMSFGDDPAKVTWFEDEMQCLSETARQLELPVAVHTGAAEGCKPALRAGVRSLEHCYLIDDDGIALAEQSGTFLVPTMQMTREDCGLWHRLRHVSLQPRNTRVSGDGRGRSDIPARLESSHQCRRESLTARRYRRAGSGKTG